MINFKIFSLSLISILGFAATDAFAMGKENTSVQEAFAALKMQQAVARPSTPLNPNNNVHRPIINLLQTPDGRAVTAQDVYDYIGFYPTR